MKVLLTGHLGYIGVEAVSVLRQIGHEVVGLDAGFYNECDFAAPPDEIPALKVRDFRDVTSDDLAGFDAVVHLAALSNDPLGDLNPSLTYDINLDGSLRLARAAKTAGISRFLFSSSCSLYGAGSDELLDENAAFNPVTPYGESKIRVEQALSELADETFSPTYFRNATAYGLSRRLRADIVVNNLVGHAVTTGKVLLKSDGTPWRPLVHIRDIIAALAAALAAPRQSIHDQAFNIGKSGENYRIRDIANMVAEIVPGSEVAFAEGASPDIRDYRVDFTKAENQLPGFAPAWTLRAGIEELYAAYKETGLTAEEFLGPRYYRLKTVQGLIDRVPWIGSYAGSHNQAPTAKKLRGSQVEDESMKAVILAGGRGTRISEESLLRPKPMIEIGGKPILWHIMKTYSAAGINDFVVCLGYKGYQIKEYFANYFLHTSDVTFDVKENKMEVHAKHAESWRVTLVDTGLDTMTGGRIKRVAPYIGDDDFCMTYGDGVSDIDIPKLLEFHRTRGLAASVTVVQPQGRFGSVFVDGEEGRVTKFEEKPAGDGRWVNAGFFVLSPKVFDYIEGDSTIWERDPLDGLARDGQLGAFRHSGFWQAMDTMREREHLEELWSSGNAPWKTWST